MSSGDNPQPDLQGGGTLKKSGNGRASSDVVRRASVSELEVAFAQNPESAAYADLCLAYIEQGRFMEAMVVCKKGIKAHPEAIEGRVLLARVYAAQKKYKRGLQELDELAAQKPNVGEVFLARGRMKLEADDRPGAIEDLKKAIDLDASLEEASKLLAEQGIEYPEKPKAPPPEPPRARPVPPAATTESSSSPSGQAPSTAAPAFALERPASEGSSAATAVPSFAPSVPPVSPPPRPVSMRQRLEGEDELENLANKIAEEKPDRGRPKVSALFAVVLLIAGAGIIFHRVTTKRRIEAIDRLTLEASAAFNQDTYGSYKTAAARFEEIIEHQDANHALTLGHLAHVYAILWGEHGEVALKPNLDAILARAEQRAPNVSHTISARGLALLYDGKDRQANAAKAQAHLEPIVQKVKAADGGPSYADLTLAIIDLELGHYESATQTFGNVKQVLPGSVRAKVWHARAAYRAGRLAASEAAFVEALRTQPTHPGARAGLALTKIVRGDLNGAAAQLVKFDELPEKEISSRDRALAEFARSEVFRAAGEEPRALGAYELAARLDPGNADFPYGLGKSLLDSDRAKDALPYLRKAVEMEKTRVGFLITLAEAEMRTDDYKAAEKHVQEALAKAPTQLETLLGKARLLRRTRSPETESFLKTISKQFPSAESEVNLELGRYYRAMDRLDEAKTALEAAIEKMSSSAPARQAEIVLSYAKLLKDRREDSSVVAASYRQAADLGNLEASFWLADTLARSSNKQERDEAKRACERYLGAGQSLTYSRDARELCDGIR